MPFQKIVPPEQLREQLNKSGVTKTADHFDVTRTAIRDWRLLYRIRRVCIYLLPGETITIVQPANETEASA